MYSDARVVEFVERHFVPVRVHVKENAAAYKDLAARYGAQWTPTVLIIGPDGREQHRVEGFLPVEDFLSQLALGVAKAAFSRNDYAIAAPLYQSIVDDHPHSDAAPEAMYWAGVSRYRATNDPAALREAGESLRTAYPDSSWAKKGSVWLS